ncbi:hypothetical protein HJG60_012071 [Phyllostomus discolor]|uniref:Uncharacterized protein n=1 Tax=Phyllostomus discolor TaxID=89673 RepID=A0A833ZM48_9CHIR|nr:hypothetical protein HJG60_012071 [Phyllostomus discolor]
MGLCHPGPRHAGRERQPRPLCPLLLFQPSLGPAGLAWPQWGPPASTVPTTTARPRSLPWTDSRANGGGAFCLGLPWVRVPASVKGHPTRFHLQTASDTFYTHWPFEPLEFCAESLEQHTDTQQG